MVKLRITTDEFFSTKMHLRRFERTGTLGVQPGRGRKRIKQEQVEEVATAVQDQAIANQ